jgi:transposase
MPSGLPMRTDITPGQTSDSLGFDLVMDDNLPESRVLLADRGYDADRIRKAMREREVPTQIPMRNTRKMRVGVDHGLYKLRNMVERCFNKLTNARTAQLATTKQLKATLGSSI